MIDFIVEVPEGREPVILQLTDMQIIDASQQRTPTRLGGVGSIQEIYWDPANKDARCYNYLRDIITNTTPDLILITGDLVYGEFDDNGQNFLELIEFMESFGIPWAPVFGNHDNESYMGVDWQCNQLEAAEHCLFLQREMTGNGNYTIGIRQGHDITRVFFMLDSNGCVDAKNINSHTKRRVGFGQDQISWYTNLANNIISMSPKTKLSMVFHVQISVFEDAFGQYGTDGRVKVDIDTHSNKFDGDFGYIGEPMKNPWGNEILWNNIKTLGFDSIFVGHVHANSASIIYEGIILQYGMKCSTYDRNNYIRSDGQIYSDYVPKDPSDKPWLGGTVMKLDREGAIIDARVYSLSCN